MNSFREPRPGLDGLVPYEAKEVRADVNLASNEHPLNLPSEIIARLSARLSEFRFNRYPDPTASDLRALIAEANGLETANVLVGNGGDELIFNILLAWGGPGRAMLDCPPTFAMYGIDAATTGTECIRVPRLADFSLDEPAVLSRVAEGDIDIVMIANPNNPTGNLVDESFLIELLNATDAIVLVDEAYFEFSRHTMRPHMLRHPNLVLLRTFSKAFSLAGLRVGYLLAHADVVTELMKVRQPYSINAFSQWVAGQVFRERVAFEQSISEIIRGRDTLAHGLDLMHDVKVFGSEANFVLFRVEHASAVWRDLLHNHSVLVRDFSRAPGLEDCMRVTVGTPEENQRFLDALDEILTSRRASEHFGEKARAKRHEDNGNGGK